MIRKNLLYNFGAKSWALLLQLVSVPLYIHYLGIEAYGLVGIYATLNSLSSLLDVGLSAVTSREICHLSLSEEGQEESAHALNSKKKLLDFCKTVEAVYWVVGGIVGLLIALLTPWIATSWIQGKEISCARIETSLYLMAFSLTTFWPFTFYSAALNALEKQKTLSSLTIFFSSLRVVVTGILLAFFSANIELFFLWQAVSYLLQTTTSSLLLRRYLPLHAGRFGMENLKNSWRFSLGVGGITLTTSFLVNVDRIILSKWVCLQEFGIYTLALAISSSLIHIAGPFFTTFFPHFSKEVLKKPQKALIPSYFYCSRLLSSLIFPLGAILIFFPTPLLLLWGTGPEIAVKLTPLLPLMAIGSISNSLLIPPCALQLSFGWTRLSLYQNLLGIPLFIPPMALAIFYAGIQGAACVGSFFQLCCLSITVPLMHRRLLVGEFKAWVYHVILPPLTISLLLGLAALLAFQDGFGPWGNFLFLGMLFSVMILGCYYFYKKNDHSIYPYAKSSPPATKSN